MFPRFFGGKQLRLCTVLYCTVPLPGPFGDFGYGGRFAGHSPDFFPPGQILYINNIINYIKNILLLYIYI